jgi:hypothetical protein
LAVASDARAQTSPTGASVVLPSITVTAPADLEKQPTDAASENGLKLNLDVLNLLNAQADQITYYYTSRLPTEPLAGVNDVHFHPVEPLAVRFTVSKAF